MKIVTTQKLLDLKGEVIKDNDVSMTVGSIVSNLLAYTKTDNQFKAYLLAKKFATEGEIEVDSEDIVFIKQAFANSNIVALAAGQTIEILEGK